EMMNQSLGTCPNFGVHFKNRKNQEHNQKNHDNHHEDPHTAHALHHVATHHALSHATGLVGKSKEGQEKPRHQHN
ncbi:hypothetical protein, partial [uncultured Marinobacter sp.]|uniref:hypothetical protein n=1 Tax=uncultured Marinobacter sp. TaxID=187379 RepID=UPI002599FDFF